MLIDERYAAIIDLDKISRNIERVRSKFGSGCKILAVVKADAYGHGGVIVARHLEKGIDYFGVATAQEALELRMNGIIKPILILGNTDSAYFGELIKHSIMPSISTVAAAEEFSEAAKKLGAYAKLHIALDTGMSRIGFVPETEIDGIIKISKLPNIKIDGIFTHFSCADEKNKEYSKKQIARFKYAINRLAEENIEIPIKHIANSAAIIDFDDCAFDMVRSGIMTYGLYPSGEVNLDFGLEPAMSLVSKLTQVHTVGAGWGVSYGATFVTKKPTRIGTVPVGYADGYPRALGNVGYVLINGCRAPIIGRVCMDQFMVDLTGHNNACAGDKVTVLGQDGNDIITIEELADKAYSFNYEFATSVGMRVTRVYLKNGEVYKRINYLDRKID